jgi:hypothetical protein
MVCYICGKPASLRCPVCGRHACNEHTRSTNSIEYFKNWLRHIGDSFENLPHYICSICFKQAVEYSNTEAQTRFRSIHYCDWHNVLHDDAYLANDKWESKLGIVYCGKCKKQICVDSTIKGATKENYFRDDSRSYEDEADALNIVTTYLCPICKVSIVMYEVRYYKAVYEYRFFSTNKKFEDQGCQMKSIYKYKNEIHKFVANPSNPNDYYGRDFYLGVIDDD